MSPKRMVLWDRRLLSPVIPPAFSRVYFHAVHPAAATTATATTFVYIHERYPQSLAPPPPPPLKGAELFGCGEHQMGQDGGQSQEPPGRER